MMSTASTSSTPSATESTTSFDLTTKLTYTWTVKRFKKRKEKVIESPLFCGPAPYDNIKWRLSLYPNGDREESRGFLSVFLHLVEPTGAALKIRYVRGLLDVHNLMISETVTLNESVFDSRCGRAALGSLSFIVREDVFDERKGYLVNGNLTIRYEVTYAAKDEELVLPIGDDADLTRDIVPDMELMLQEKTLFDVILTVDGLKVQAHKAILASKSSVFRAMFQPKTQESIDGVVDIKDVGFGEVQRMVRFIYTGKVAARFCNFALLAVADKYDIQGLKAICEKHLSLQLNVGNALQDLIKAERHSAHLLMEKAIAFVVNNVKDMMETEGWNKELEKHPKIMLKIMNQMSQKM